MFNITDRPIDINQTKDKMANDFAGATITFEGRVRSINDNSTVTMLHYECFNEMALLEGNKVINIAKGKFDVLDIHCIHRTGDLVIRDLAMYIVVISLHREAAFQACSYVVDEIKLKVPIWKKEFYKNSSSLWHDEKTV